MSDTRIVFVGRLTTGAPGTVVYHTTRGYRWDRTDCGRSIAHRQNCPDGPSYINDMQPCRRDIAETVPPPLNEELRGLQKALATFEKAGGKKP